LDGFDFVCCDVILFCYYMIIIWIRTN